MAIKENPMEDLSSDMPPNLIEPEQKEGISKNAILLLLVLTIFVSAAGTWMVLKATANLSPTNSIQQGSPSTVGQATVNIVKQNGPSTGYATIQIVKRG